MKNCAKQKSGTGNKVVLVSSYDLEYWIKNKMVRKDEGNSSTYY